MRSSSVVCLLALLVVTAAPAVAQDRPLTAVSADILTVAPQLPTALAPRAGELARLQPASPFEPRVARSVSLQVLSVAPAEFPGVERPRALVPLYASLATLNALDVHSTLTGLSNGGREANPVMKPFAEHGGALIALKATATVATIWLTEKSRRRYPKRAVVVMAVTNAAMATVVANNYRLRRQ